LAISFIIPVMDESRYQKNLIPRLVFFTGATLLAISLIFALALRLTQSFPVEFHLTSLEHTPVTLSSYRGQVVVLNFWASWCLPCTEEMPDLETLYQEYKDSGLVIIGVNVNESEMTAANFVRETGITFPIVLDAEGRTATQFGVSGLPVTFLLDKNGQIVYRHNGQIQKEDIAQRLEILLNK
jgi:DsbE subfamily thiol:disulfide oxidoreductase